MSFEFAPDDQLALQAAVDRLYEEFGGHFSTRTIRRVLHSSFDAFMYTSGILAGLPRTPTFTPMMAERFARDRLYALGRAEGIHDDRKQAVLFLCVENAGRSQMALGFFRHYAGDQAVGWSGGSDHAMSASRVATAVMAERGIDISQEFPKPWTQEIARGTDVVITMGCAEASPRYRGARYEEWKIENTGLWDIERVRPVRDHIEQRVLRLLDELGIQAAPASHYSPSRHAGADPLQGRPVVGAGSVAPARPSSSETVRRPRGASRPASTTAPLKRRGWRACDRTDLPA